MGGDSGTAARRPGRIGLMKSPITPGRLYAKLATEFRRAACEKCAHCVLPIPSLADEDEDGTWTLGTLPGACEECQAAIARIVRRHQAKYDLVDPVSRILAHGGTTWPAHVGRPH